MSLIKHGEFFYLGTPYSKFHEGLEAAFHAACGLTAILAELGVPVYSPIAHSHPVSIYCNVSPTDHDFWVKFDAPMVKAAGGLIVAMLPGWEVSRGLLHEILQFQRSGRPVIYWDPNTTPDVSLMIPSVMSR